MTAATAKSDYTIESLKYDKNVAVDKFPVTDGEKVPYIMMAYVLADNGYADAQSKEVTANSYTAKVTLNTYEKDSSTNTYKETPNNTLPINSVPLNKNYRTNINGMLFTEQPVFTVKLAPTFGNTFSGSGNGFN